MASKLINLLVALASATAVVVALEVPVTIYYESLCSDSLKFFKEQFVPVYSSALKKYINPSFNPWGHANISGDALNCQHGPVECDGNRLQACALHKINETDIKAAYVGCIMSLNITKNITKFPNEECKSEAGKFYNDIQACYTDTAASLEFLKSYQSQTESAFKGGNFSVPFISINNTIDTSVSENAAKNFKSVLCNNLKSEKLKECGNSASKFTATLIPAAILFLLGRV